MKFPTIFGLALLFLAFSLSIVIYVYQRNQAKISKLNFTPQKIRVVNITDTSFTLTWQTQTPTFSEVISGSSPQLKLTPFNLNMASDKIFIDDRDLEQNRQLRLTHFITINGLKPDSNYYVKIKGGNFYYPDKPIEVKTGILELSDIPNTTPSQLKKPIRGNIVNLEGQPIDEALIFLNIEGALKKAAFSSKQGSFLISLNNVYNSNAHGFFNLNPDQKTDAELLISRNNIESSIKIFLPLPEGIILPALKIGEDIDLKSYLSSPPAQTKIVTNNKFDLNKDGIINSLDVSLVLDNIGKKSRNSIYDLNLDGVINQKDIDLIKQSLQE